MTGMSAWNKIQSWLNTELASDSTARPTAPVATAPKVVQSPAPPGTASSEPTKTLAWVLQTFGDENFDLETGSLPEQREGWSLWANHVEHQTVPDWNGLRKFVGSQRKFESSFVTHNVKELRSTLWDLLQRLGNTVVQDALDDGTLGEQLQKLRVVVEEKPVEDIRREVLSAVETIGNLVHKRQSRQRREIEEAVNQLGTVRKELSKTRKEMSQDGLTRLFNRASFDEHLQAMTALGNLTGEPCVLVMVDIDHFKSVNDRLGHPAGDEVLRQVADALARAFPRRTDFVARYGGEEFAIILPDTPVAEIPSLCNRALEAVRILRIALGEEELKTTISVGAANLRRGETPKQWLERADKALYAAKNGGRNTSRLG